MIIVDKALETREAEGRPVRIALIGAGFMGRGIVLQVLGSIPGMDVAVVANRSLEGAKRAYAEAGDKNPVAVETVQQLEAAINL